MKAIIRILWGAAIVGLLAAGATAAEKEGSRPLIQMAILLDNSGSMRGLINQAKTQLWHIVNEFATTKKNGQVPEIQVALYTYGDPPPKMILPLTNDLDAVSEKLFAVQIRGGSEYCGQVIQAATQDLNWSKSNDDLKVIFIAGNEPFTQGQVDYRTACREAIAKGIIVNTIHCGSHDDGVSGKWQDGAQLADGKYMNIDQNEKVVHIEAPQDEEIRRLSAELNTTYIAYGAEGVAGRARQTAEDKNASALAPEVLVERTVAKAGEQYRNESWDLVDALEAGKVKLKDVKKEDLPTEMEKMNEKEREEYVQSQVKKREEIRAKINTLNEARTTHIAAKRAELAEKGEDTLGAAIVKTAREQAAAKNFEVQKAE